MIMATVVGDKHLIAKLSSAYEIQSSFLKSTVQRLTIALQRRAKQKVSGEVLKVRTGRLRRSINQTVETTSSSIVGRVGVDGALVPYARIHEYGGTIPAHDIVPVNAQALSFQWQGKNMFLKKVHIPDVVMPERSYLRSSLSDMKAEINDKLQKAINQATKATIK